MAVKVSACPRDCYSTCSFLVPVRNGKIGLIEPHPDNKATSEGICLKGISYTERVYHPDRLLYPMKKNGKGNFERISWDDALKEISTKIKDIHNEYGPKSILYYAATGTKGLLNGTGSAFWELTGGFTSTYGDLCWPSGLEATRLTLGDNIHNVPWDMENAGLIVAWGKNISETNVHQMKFIENSLKRGGKLVVIDPRRTETTSKASIHISPEPGTDGALALGIANMIIKKGYTDKFFIEKNIKGFEEFRELVSRYTPEKVSEITTVAPVDIEKVADLMGRNSPMTLTAGFGMQRYRNSGQTMRALISLPVITGNIGKKGAGWMYANLQSHIFDEVTDPLAIYPDNSKKNIRNSISVAKLGRGILEASDPPVKMIWVERGNPVVQNPDTENVLKAFRSLDFRVVVDQFLTDTAKEADIVLPAKTMFEQSDVINAYWHHYIQLKQKVIDPPGEVKPESEVYYLLAEELGISQKKIDGVLPVPGDKGVEDFLKKKLSPFPGLDLESLKKGPVSAPGSSDIAFNDMKFKTPSGKIELFSEEAVERWGVDPLPDYSPPVVKNDKKLPFIFLTSNTKNRIHSQFGNMRSVRQFHDPQEVKINPDDAQKKGIFPGDKVEVFNERGKIEGKAVFDFGLRSGCILVNNGRWMNEGGSVNFLTEQLETDMGYGAAFYDNRVDIRKSD
ncbi:MAG: molybdopterin-dependent oxidoreductase [Acidobacteriota bacterium]